MLSRNESLYIKESERRCTKEIVVEVGEFCNKIITDKKGTFLHIDKSLLREVIDYLEGLE